MLIWGGNLSDGSFGNDVAVKLSPKLTLCQSAMLDTRHFSADFTARLLAALGDLDDKTDGVLFHSENFQALNLMQARYKEKVKCVYIDPPYNTDASPIDYKNGYKASSWITLLTDRVSLSRSLLTQDGDLVAAIDDEQQRELSFILSDVFTNRILGTICVRANPSGRPTQTGYSVSHEYLIFAGVTAKSAIGRLPPTEDQQARFNQKDEHGPFEWRNLRREGSNSDRDARRALYYPIYVKGNSIRVPKMTWNEETEEWDVEEKPGKGEQEELPDNEDGVQKNWRWDWQTVMDSLDKLAVRPDRMGRDYIYYKRRPHEDGVVSVSSWFDAKYSATEHGTALLKSLFGQSPFSYPKSIHAVSDAIYIAGASDSGTTILDFFGGSGTTAHAVINLNREDNGRKRFILVDMANYFDTVLMPRLKKVAFTPERSEGKPSRAPTSEEIERGPRVFKIVRLESYEDTLNNLELKRSPVKHDLLSSSETQGADKFREQYLLHYMLKVESRASQSLLNVAAFTDPTAYRLRVKRPGSGESREVNVDLLESFNWLLGLTVQHIAAPQTFAAKFERDAEKRLQLKGKLNEASGGPFWFRTVTGTMPDGRKRECELPHLEYQNLAATDPNMLGVGETPSDAYYRILIAKSEEVIVKQLEELKAAIEKDKQKLLEFRSIKSIWFGKHLYQPLLYVQDKGVEISPAPLNKGERQFVEDLKAFHDNDGGFFKDKELYLLRNLSKGRGVGFFEAGNFHPDFILWLLIGDTQHVIFVDPKGIRNIGKDDPKIQFRETIKEIETRLGNPDVHLHSFIVSNTPSVTMQMLWSMDKPAMVERHVLFQEEDKHTYVRNMLVALQVLNCG